jgi:hypothetical protein
MDSKGKGKSPAEPQLTKEEVTGESLALLISYLQGLQVGTSSSKSQGSGEFQLSPLAMSRTGTQDSRKPGTKVLGEESVRYWTTLDGSRKIRKLRAEEGIPTPLCKSRGIVEALDLVTREKACGVEKRRLPVQRGGSGFYQRQFIAHLLPHFH